MALIKVDPEKCDMDARCVETCPVHILALDPEKGPVVREGRAKFCIGCGHCVAVCETRALDNVRNPLSQHSPISSWPPVSPESTLELLKSRRSIRCYREEPVDKKTLEELMEAARWAPAGHNMRHLSYIIVDGRDAVLRVLGKVVDWMREMVEAQDSLALHYHFDALVRAHERGEDRILRGAPQLIVAHAPKGLWIAQIDTALALEYVELYAVSLGLGTCWAGFVQVCADSSPGLGEFLGIPEDRAITGVMMVGYPRYTYRSIPTRAPLDLSWIE